TDPGTPEASCPRKLRSTIGLPSSSRNMSVVAAAGAASRKSSEANSPSALRYTIKPPPPILPALGYTTASANCTATAASTALPPSFNICNPTAEASGCAVTTAACSYELGDVPSWGARHDINPQHAKAIRVKARALFLVPVNDIVQLSKFIG